MKATTFLNNSVNIIDWKIEENPFEKLGLLYQFPNYKHSFIERKNIYL